MNELDNDAVVAARDSAGALSLAEKTLDQLTHDFGIEKPNATGIANLVFSGMGGSALQAELLKTWPRLTIPYEVTKTYTVPEYVNGSTLVIVSSYSGNTEEALSSLADARRKGARIVVMAGGGKLQEIAEDHGDQFILLPKAVQPRMAIFYAYRAVLETLVAYGLVDVSRIAELEASAERVKQLLSGWVQSVPTEHNEAKQLALQLVGKTPIYYAGPLMAPVAYKWKINTNENAKNTAWYNLLSEFNHNEFMGWTSHPIEKPFAVVDLISSFEHERIIKRFEVGDRLLSGMRPHAISIHAKGETMLDHLLYLTVLGDFVTIYLGLLNGVDPSPVKLIEKFKVELGPFNEIEAPYQNDR